MKYKEIEQEVKAASEADQLRQQVAQYKARVEKLIKKVRELRRQARQGASPAPQGSEAQAEPASQPSEPSVPAPTGGRRLRSVRERLTK